MSIITLLTFAVARPVKYAIILLEKNLKILVTCDCTSRQTFANQVFFNSNFLSKDR